MRLLLALTLTSALAATAAAQTDAPPPGTPPASAVAALDRASAAYEFGDMNQVVDAARPIVDGALAATAAEQQQALRLLGIGLYLTGRPSGAETAFLELLRSQPRARLDPRTTRPEVVAFIEDVRRRHASEIQDAARARSHRSALWSLIPPVGQFKNGDDKRGAVILGLEVASLAGAVTTHAVLDRWRQPYDEFPGHEDAARTLKTVNYISVGVLAATWVVGVIDAYARSDREPEPAVSLAVTPTGLALAGRF